MTPIEEPILNDMRKRRPGLDMCIPALLEAHSALIKAYDANGKLMICGNGGSCADAMHIAGELCKSFERRRPLPEEVRARMAVLPLGEELLRHLEAGLPALALGCNAALRTAVENDARLPGMGFAQEAAAFTRPGDVLLAISTSGNAANCLMAMTTAQSFGAVTIALTGPSGGRMAGAANISICAPGSTTKEVQEAHLVLYHTLCALVEVHYFPESRIG